MHKVKGKIKEVVGKIVNNRDLEAEGQDEKLNGKAQKEDRSDQEGRGQVERGIMSRHAFTKDFIASRYDPAIYRQKTPGSNNADDTEGLKGVSIDRHQKNFRCCRKE